MHILFIIPVGNGYVQKTFLSKSQNATFHYTEHIKHIVHLIKNLQTTS